MTAVVIVGAQWGDEGKGKVVDLYTENADMVVRYGGGANAGHTLVVEGKKLVTHLIPSGVFRKETKLCLGDGMVVDPTVLIQEIEDCQALGLLDDETRLSVSRHAHVIFPFHKAVDELRESGQRAIGTTRRGIGPAYEAKVARRGIRMETLLRAADLEDQIARNLDELNPILERMGGKPFEVTELLEEGLRTGERLARHIGDVRGEVHKALKRGDNVLFEGAQGTLLDLDHGTYPFVTSCSTIAGGACTGVGVGPTVIEEVVGIAKCYTTRVGSGPFPTELTGSLGARLREAGMEYGSTTGRPRRCGWLDIPALRMAVSTNGLGGLALTKLDCLSAMDKVRMCVGYKLDGAEVDELPTSPHAIEKVEPIYEEFDGWAPIKLPLQRRADLPASLLRYLDRIEELLEIPLFLLSVGPGREDTVVEREIFTRS